MRAPAIRIGRLRLRRSASATARATSAGSASATATATGRRRGHAQLHGTAVVAGGRIVAALQRHVAGERARAERPAS